VPAPTNRVPLSRDIELERIIPLSQAAELRSDSEDTIRREDAARIARGEPSQIIRLSVRRVGMRLRDALMLPAKTEARSP